MIISNLYVNSFRSILQLSIPIDPTITVLIGPNESGKTNVLSSIKTIRPDVSLSMDMTCQYSDFYTQGNYPQIAIEFTNYASIWYDQLLASRRRNRRSLIGVGKK